MIRYSKYFEVVDDILKHSGWEIIGQLDRQAGKTKVLIRVHKAKIPITEIGTIHINLEMGQANLSTDIYELKHFGYHFQPLSQPFRAFRVDSDARQGLHANDDSRGHYTTDDGLTLEKVNMATFLGLVQDYLYTQRYPFSPENFANTNDVLARYMRRVVYDKARDPLL